MPTYGLTSTGLAIKSLEIIREEINQALRDEFGQSIKLGDKDVLGHIVGIVSEREALIWELLEAVNSSQDPDKAVQAQLDSVAALTGTTRDPATHSTVTLTLTGTNGTVIPDLSQASTLSTGQKFETLSEVTLSTLTSWAATTAYVVGDRVKKNDSGTDRCYHCITAGTSGSSGPSGTGSDITDGTVHWRYLGNGTSAVDADARSVDTGPIVAVSGDITVIETPVSGWQGVINLLDATLGADEETDEALRIRREDEVDGGGSTIAGAIKRALDDLLGVTAVRLFVNASNVTDADGVPAHSVEALVTGGTDQDIWDALLDNVAAGIQTWGTEIGISTDSEGNEQEMRFSRPSLVNIYVTIDVIKDPNTFPADGSDQIEAAIVAYGDAQSTGKDVVSSALSAQAFTVAGVLDVTACKIGTSASPTLETTITITSRQLAVFDTSRITVNLTNGTP